MAGLAVAPRDRERRRVEEQRVVAAVDAVGREANNASLGRRAADRWRSRRAVLRLRAELPVLHCAGRLVRCAGSAEDGGLDAAMETEAFMCGAEGACSGHSN